MKFNLVNIIMFILAIYIMVGCSNKVMFNSGLVTEPEAAKIENNLSKQKQPVEDQNCVSDGTDAKKMCNVVCHVPPGNPANAHTIVIGFPAVNPHLSHHNDYLGPCNAQGGGEEPGGEEPVCTQCQL